MELNRKALIKAAKEMNEVMGLTEPALDTSLAEEPLKLQMLKAIELIDPDEDTFTDETQTIIEALIAGQEDDNTPKRSKPKAAPKAEAKDDEGDDEGEELTLAQVVANTRKLKDLKELVTKHSDFKKLRKSLEDYQGLTGPKELQAEMFKILGVEAPKAAPKAKAKKEPKERVSRLQATAKAILEGISNKEKLAARADELFAANGGKANVKEAEADCRRAYRLLVALGIGTETSDSFTYKE